MNAKTFSSLCILLCFPVLQAADILFITEDIANPSPVGPIAGVDFENPANTAYEIASCLVGSEMCIRDRD